MRLIKYCNTIKSFFKLFRQTPNTPIVQLKFCGKILLLFFLYMRKYPFFIEKFITIVFLILEGKIIYSNPNIFWMLRF
jgi:hypothetical protein